MRRTSGTNSEHRNKNDKYLTPVSMVTQLLENEPFDINDSVLECCSDKNRNIETVLRNNGFTNVKSNIYENEDGMNFLDWDENDKYDIIISNTPYDRKASFAIKAMKVAKKKIALLYPLYHCTGLYRYQNLFHNNLGFKLSKLYIFVRESFLKNDFIDGKGIYYLGQGVVSYCWYIFDKECNHEPIIRWINNNEYILGSTNCKLRWNRQTKQIEPNDKNYVGKS